MRTKVLCFLLTLSLILGIVSPSLQAQAAQVEDAQLQTPPATRQTDPDKAEYDIVYPLPDGELRFHSASGTIVFGNGSGVLNVPESIEGHAVTAIGYHAFSGTESVNARFEEIHLPDSITHIGEAAFYWNPSLVSISFPAHLEVIPPDALYRCNRLSQILWPESLKEIGDHAFGYINGFQTLNIPEGVERIGDGAFVACSRLTEITLPESLVEIGQSAFYECKNLKQLELPQSLREVPENLCYECTALEQVKLPDQTKVIGDSAFSGCKSLSTITLPSTVQSIEAYAFQGCPFTELSLPASLTSIGDRAFNANRLTAVDLPDSLCSLGSGAFASTTLSLEEEGLCKYLDGWVVSMLRKGNGTYTVRKGTVGIAKNVIGFQHAADYPDHFVNTLKLPASLQHMDQSCFYDASQLYNLTVAKENPFFAVQDNILYTKDFSEMILCPGVVNAGALKLPESLRRIGEKAFSHNSGTYRLCLPETVEEIGKYAFYLSDLKYIRFGTGLKRIEAGAFYCCKLTTLTLPDGLEYIGDSAFSRCDLVHLDLGHGLREIGAEAFSYNSHLRKLSVPASVEVLGEASFFGCRSLESVRFWGDAPELGICVFYESPNGSTYRPYGIPWYRVIEGLTLQHSGGNGWDAVKEYPTALWKAPTVQKFNDVSSSAWYAEAVDYAVREGLMYGVGGGKFDPEEPMTRAMVVTVLWRLMNGRGGYASSIAHIQDVKPGQWYSEAVGWAVCNGIVKGTDSTHFSPNDPVTREQLVTILYRVVNNYAYDASDKANLDSFPDRGSVSRYATQALQWAVGSAVICGVTTGGVVYLRPQNSATRAQVAAIFMRFIEDIMK